MKNTRLLLSTACMAIGLSFPVLAEPTNAELDQRLRAVEGNIQTILELLKAQQTSTSDGGTATTSDIGAAPEVLSAGYQMGALYLDVFTGEKQNEGMRYDPSKIPATPKGLPAGSSVIQANSSFGYSDFLKESSLAGLGKADALVSIRWSGVLLVTTSGDHTFSIQLKKDENTRVESCRSVLQVNNELVVDTLGDYPWSREQIDTAQGAEALAPGYYDISISIACYRDRMSQEAYGGVSVALTLAAPGDRAPKPIPPERFGIRS